MASKGSLRLTIIDEIALEGLEGITLPSLWVRLSVSLGLQVPLLQQFQEQVWSFLLTAAPNQLQFYKLPAERSVVVLYNRFEDVDPFLGVPISPDECPFLRYKCVPIQDGLIMGSCENYKERKQIPVDQLQTLNYALNRWGNRLIIVASQKLRYDALIPANIPLPKELTPMQYCVLEAIGRSRFNGETTAGNWSLLQYCKDSTITFYIKNKLIRQRVLAQQPYNEKRNERLLCTTLLTLQRFYTTNKSMLASVIEKVFQILKQAPNHSMTMLEVRKCFPSIDHNKSFKKITMTHFYRRLFETLSLPYSEACDVLQSSKKPPTKRTSLVIRLRNPNLSIDELFLDENNDDKDEVWEDFHDEKHSFVDMPLKDEFYRAVARHGSRGCSQTELCAYLSLPHLTVRQFLRQGTTEGYIKFYCIDVGRQRTNMYVAVEHSDSIKKNKDVSMAVLKNLQCADEPNIPESNEVMLADIPSITSRIKSYEYSGIKNERENISQRLLGRKSLVVQTIDKKCIVQVSELRTTMQQVEKENGYKDEMCRKSVRRLLHNLSKSNIVCIYEIMLQFDEHIRLYRFVTHPKIGIDHEIIQREILKLKNNLFLSIEERRLRTELHAKDQLKRAVVASRKVSKAAEKRVKEVIHLHTYKPPKFLISRYMHEFIFYIVVELNEYQTKMDITEELLLHWKQSEPDLATGDYMDQWKLETPTVQSYTRDLSWRTFIPPLPKYADKPAGWVFFMDAVERMPLSMFNKIFRIEKGADKRLAAYMAHPVRQHYLMKQLPADLQCQISRIQLQKIYVVVLKLLNNMGLVQVSERQNPKDPLIMWVYLNRHAQILDTTTTEASFSNINPDREYTAVRYEFNSFDDIHQYWTSLQRICIYTKLGFRRGKTDRLEKKERSKELVFTGTVGFDEAPIFDTGTIPGEHLGAAGLSRTLFAHTFRNWSWVLPTNTKIKAQRTGRTTRIKGATKMGVRKSRSLLPPLRRLPGGTSSAAQVSVRIPAKKTCPRDAIDRDALKNMRTLRVSWRREEDDLLKMARAVYLYIAAPVPALGLLAVGKVCRDVMRHMLGSYNKTSQACVRRGQFIIKHNRHVPQVPTWMHMLQTNKYIQERYGDNFLLRLKKVYPHRVEYCAALTIHFILILIFLYKLINDLQINASVSRFTIPDTIAEFHKRFLERPHIPDDQVAVHTDPESEFDLQLSIVYNTLHSSLCCTRDKTLYSAQSFDIYKNYSEELLHAAFTKARSDGLAVPVKRKHIQKIPNHLAGPAYLLSSKYRLRLMFLKIPYNVYDAFYRYFNIASNVLFGNITSTKQYLELKSPHLGQLFFIGEGLAFDYWQSNIKLPINILTVDAEQRQTVSSMDRILDHYHSIFDNAPETEYTKHFETETSERQIRVKFHPANLSYKMHYSPYDLISKLPTRYLHFFCALDHLQQEVDINFSKLHRKDEEQGCVVMECPFSCIMKNANYINAIERIVQEKRTVLNDLSEMPPQKLLNLATSGCSVTVQPTNLLTLVRMLESFWREKELQSERKDLGKLSANVKSTKSIDWHQMCNDILEYNANEDESEKNDEYEPTLNKEERIVRAQDVFVVNLPTIQISAKSKIGSETDPKQLKDNAMPKCIMDTEIRREAVLQKINCQSFWKYTENTFETLKPQLDKLNFNVMEQQHLEEVHNYIESRKLGVLATELMREFPYEHFLLRALQTLGDHWLIKRVGIASIMYVHKTNIRPWIVHTFHVKRLERENQGDNSMTSLKKRKLEQVDNGLKNDSTNEEEPTASTSKKSKLMESAKKTDEESKGEFGKRLIKPVKRFVEDNLSEIGTSNKSEATRDVIVMKPQPWMRLNGSLNRRVLDRWMGTLLTECIARSGCSVPTICIRFPHMLPVDIMFLLEILSDIKCIHLTQIQTIEVDLLSEYENIKETIVTELYDPQHTYVTAHADAVIRMAIFIGNKKYNTEFI